MRTKWSCALVCLLLVISTAFAAEPEKGKPRPEEPAAPGSDMRKDFTPGSWTLAVLPDTQHETKEYPGVSLAETAWLALNRERFNIVYALTVGDLTNNNAPDQWGNCKAAFSLLDGKLPYVLVIGNHDFNFASRAQLINRYFPVKMFESWPTFGGVKDEGLIENNYHLFEAGGKKWIVLALEWAPRDQTVEWANTIMQKYPDRLGILLTHAYLYRDSTRYDHTAAEAKKQMWSPYDYHPNAPINDGQELWDKLVRKHNFAFVLSGHVLLNGTGYRVDKNDAGRPVHQILANYQMRELGGGAYMRLMEFLPDGNTVKVRSYSPIFDRLLTAPDQQFTLTLDGSPVPSAPNPPKVPNPPQP